MGGRKGRKSFCQAGVFLSFAKKPFLKQVVWPKLKNVILGKREREKARYRERERERDTNWLSTGYQFCWTILRARSIEYKILKSTRIVDEQFMYLSR